MPPAVFVTAIAASATADAQATTRFLTPSTVQADDTLIAVIVGVASGPADVAAVPAGFVSIHHVITGAGHAVNVLRKTATSGEPAQYVFTMTGSGSNSAGVLLVYRGLDNSISAPIAASTVDVAASTSWPCPVLAMTSYSDLYLGIAYRLTSATVFTPPVGAIELIDVAIAGGGGGSTEIAVDQVIKETITTVGATQTNTSGSGTATGLLLAVTAPKNVRSVAPEIPGAIGLPLVGV